MLTVISYVVDGYKLLWVGSSGGRSDKRRTSKLIRRNHMFIVYVIFNENGKIYIGQTSDLEKRMKRYNGILRSKTKSFTNKNKGIWKVEYTEEFDTREEAIEREKQLKSYQGRKFIRNISENKY